MNAARASFVSKAALRESRGVSLALSTNGATALMAITSASSGNGTSSSFSRQLLFERRSICCPCTSSAPSAGKRASSSATSFSCDSCAGVGKNASSDGVSDDELVPDDENLHFSSVLAIHRASKTLHVDDTLNYARLPKILSGLKKDVLRFHPTLGKVLERRAGAVKDFRAWAEELIERLRDVDNLCTAHVGNLLASENDGPSIAARVRKAYDKLDGTLSKHASRYG